ncbi:MerR family transcriptional regulator [Prauserella flavalba]|uniref:MerR family transcriptional regulator n=1 Tax=Prauserella flavalba TaxID=1477506 RepID=A0A318LUI9_9PSEU|nr:MerR family transcriptional regulator [Prauserella flavalba]PXY36018.1 MerR family transcriptional regulator [Prauserella flavalba]
MRDVLLTIGRFARLCRLSVKQLRHYDELGLLAPVHVDASSGYRYYAPEQARDALTIALLRELDLPLAVIAEALAAEPGHRTRILRGERDRLAERIDRDRARLAMLERLAEDGLPGYEITLTDEPQRRLAVVRAVCTTAEIGAAFGDCVGRLLSALGAAGRAWEPPLWGLYPLDLDEPLAIAVGAQAPAGHDVHGLESTTLPCGLVAETVHTGPYAQLALAYNALFAAIHERGLRPRAPVREAYLVAPPEARAEELVTRLIVPVEEYPA